MTAFGKLHHAIRSAVDRFHAAAEVSVVRVGTDVEVTVLDDGTGEPAPDAAPDGGGHGLLGMRERVTAVRGTLTTGPRYGGGFRVHAILPVGSRTDTAQEPA